jgi:hypothetical protein
MDEHIAFDSQKRYTRQSAGANHLRVAIPAEHLHDRSLGAHLFRQAIRVNSYQLTATNHLNSLWSRSTRWIQRERLAA